MRPIVADADARSLSVVKGVENESSRVESSGEGPRKRGVEVVAALLVKERGKKKNELYKTPEEEYNTRRLLLPPIRIRPRMVNDRFWMQDKIIVPFP